MEDFPDVRAYTGREIAKMTNDQPEYIAAPYVALGVITEWSGKIKRSGKTTLASYLCRAVLRGETFLGRPTRYQKVLYVTEQNPETFRQSIAKSGLLEHDDFYAMFANDFRQAKLDYWDDITDVIGDKAHKLGCRLIWLDTLMELAKVRKEEDPSEATEKMERVKLLADAGNAVDCIRHDRKMGGDVGDSSRGSSNWGGQMDMMCQLVRPAGGPTTKRELWSIGRLESPPFLLIDLTDEGYVVRSTERDPASEDQRPTAGKEIGKDAITFLVSREPMTVSQLVEQTGKPQSTVYRWLAELIDERRVVKLEDGRYTITLVVQAEQVAFDA